MDLLYLFSVPAGLVAHPWTVNGTMPPTVFVTPLPFSVRASQKNQNII